MTPSAALFVSSTIPVALDRVLIVAAFGDGTSTIGSAGRARRPPALSGRRSANRWRVWRVVRPPTLVGPLWGQVERSGVCPQPARAVEAGAGSHAVQDKLACPDLIGCVYRKSDTARHPAALPNRHGGLRVGVSCHSSLPDAANQAVNACLTRAAVIGKRRMRLAVAL
jgi:hypothetical protein